MAKRYLLPYPLRAVCLELTFHPFCWGLSRCSRLHMAEHFKANAETQWWVRFGCFTLSYRRML